MSKIITIGTRIKALSTSKHHGYTGTVLVLGQYLVIKCDPDSENPASWKSACYGDGKFFCLDMNSAAPIKG